MLLPETVRFSAFSDAAPAPSLIPAIKLGGCFGYREGLQKRHYVHSYNNKQINGVTLLEENNIFESVPCDSGETGADF